MRNLTILLIKHGALGDLIQSFGVLKDIRMAYPAATISLLTAKSYVSLMKECRYIDNIIVDNRLPLWHIFAYLELGRLLKKTDVDLVIDLQNSDRTRIYYYCWFRKKQWFGRAVGAATPISGLDGMIEILEKNGIQTVFSRQPDLNWMLRDTTERLRDLQLNTPYVVLIPGSSAKNKEKRWPFYAKLADLLANEGLNVVCVVGPEEADLMASFSCKVLQCLDWFTLASLLKESHFVVGNDTGPSHIAAHVGANGVAIFGPNTSAKRANIHRQGFHSLALPDLNLFDAHQMHAWLKQKFAFNTIS